MKRLTATSEEALQGWVEKLQESVRDTTKPEALKAKEEAAAKIMPLMMAQAAAARNMTCHGTAW